ncbi:MAG: FecR domain-containing protein [Flavobacteriales bacterium]|nr:FecR domain-containing protein [Flavobacteriales bacterium]
MERAEEYKELIQKVISGDASPVEMKTLEAILNNDIEKNEYFVNISKVNDLSDQLGEFHKQLDVEADYQAFLKKKEDDGKIIPIGASYSGLNMIFKIAALFLISCGTWYAFNRTADVEIVADATSNENSEKVFSDMSTLKLSKNSKISYPKAFASNERIVNLQGEGYFEIESDPERPFIVQVGDISVKVLGTKFNVNARDLDSVVVTVIEGSVALYRNDDNDKMEGITAGMKGTLSHDNSKAEISTNENLNFLYWYNGKLKFVNSTLEEVAFVLNREMHSKIKINSNSIKNCLFSGSLDNVELSEILELLEITLGLDVEKSENKVLLSGEGC